MIANLLTDPNASQQHGVWLLSQPNRAFEDAYIALRKTENRVVSDELLTQLPTTPSEHPHHREWTMRQRSSSRALSLITWNGPVLDLGCGNGWFTNAIAAKCEHPVIGLDVNLPELEQAARTFSRPNLSFAYGDVFSDLFAPASFGVITVNSCLQYFEDATATINRLLELLNSEGRIFIIDSPFYDADKVEAARQRSTEYYTQMGFPEMSAHYFHHAKSLLKPFNGELVYDPSSLRNRARRLRGQLDSPFPLVRICK